MPGYVTEEQVRLARKVDLLSYLRVSEPHELLPPKNGEYRTVTHGSLVISNGQWYWNRGGFGGVSALDYLIKIRGMGFIEAVETVLGSRGDFRADVPGSDKQYSFTLPAENPDSRHLAVFESPADALSHATLGQRGGWDWDGYRLSLAGTSSVALISFLKRNPQITRVTLHLDNDNAGLIAARRIKARLAGDDRFKRIHVSINAPRGAKDYNDVLLRVIGQEKEQKQHRRQADYSF